MQMQIDDDVSLFIIIVMKEGDWVIFPTFKKKQVVFQMHLKTFKTILDHVFFKTFVKLREREVQRVDSGRSLKGHL